MSVKVEAATTGLSRGLVHELLTAAWTEPSVRTFGEASDEASGAPAAVRFGIRGFGASIRVSDRTGLGLADRIRALVAPELIDGHRGPYQHEMFATARVDGRIALWGKYDFNSAEDPSTATRLLVAMIDFTIATEATEALFVHAGVVGWRGRAILVPGRSGTGKSSLIAALVRQGAEYYSDEFAPIGSAGLVHPYARTATMRNGMPGPPRSAATGPPLPVGAIIATTFHPGARWQPRLVGGVRGLLPIFDNALVCRDQPQAAFAAARSISPVVALVGPRGEADEVAAAMLERVDQVQGL